MIHPFTLKYPIPKNNKVGRNYYIEQRWDNPIDRLGYSLWYVKQIGWIVCCGFGPEPYPSVSNQFFSTPDEAVAFYHMVLDK